MFDGSSGNYVVASSICVACVEAYADTSSVLNSGSDVFDVLKGRPHTIFGSRSVLQKKNNIVLNCGKGVVNCLNNSSETALFSVSEVASQMGENVGNT